jgi:glutathione S-transferase
MSDLILHHYPTSPFAEKIRLVLGYKQLAWKSVIIPMMMPKPDVVALTGGYRRTPILQIGADIYCDSALICDVLEHIQPARPLYPEAHKGLARIVAQWGDSLTFGPVMAFNFQPSGAAEIMGHNPPEWVTAFVQDRQAMRGGAPRMNSSDAAATYKSYLRRLSDMLTHQPFLLGDAPSIADFSAAHPIWFTQVRTPSLAGVLDATPLVKAWLDRVMAFGHGQSSEISSADALAISHASTPAPLVDEPFQDDHGIPLGTEVVVAADTFGTEPTTGQLVAATRTRLTLRRTKARAGTVHVHFPRIGFTLKKVFP